MTIVAEKEVTKPPQCLIDQCAEINKQRLGHSSGVLELYWVDSMWKYRVRHRRERDVILIDHIRQESFAHNDHWVVLAVSGVENAYHRGLIAGKLDGVDRMVNNACHTLGVSKDMYLKHLNEKGMF